MGHANKWWWAALAANLFDSCRADCVAKLRMECVTRNMRHHACLAQPLAPKPTVPKHTIANTHARYTPTNTSAAPQSWNHHSCHS